ncbi:hypothetical protein [Streptomyces sp. RPT161]|uniref:hypothetical protein n=1 Tax=Streptomyces sp. RPT161 TaxID=3015993 RepID=UPI0022B93CDE|nr:hypothetical protein [Streptomyces sp. RPT161]
MGSMLVETKQIQVGAQPSDEGWLERGTLLTWGFPDTGTLTWGVPKYVVDSALVASAASELVALGFCSGVREASGQSWLDLRRGRSTAVIPAASERQGVGEASVDDVQIHPHVSVGPFQLGMPFHEAMRVTQGLGRISHRPGAERPAVVNLDDSAFQFVLSFPQDGTLTSVELWRFRVEDDEFNVTFDGLDVFRTPSERLVPQVEEHGHSVAYDDDFGIYALPKSKISFANNSSYEYPVDPEGDPVYFDYVLSTTQPVR